MQIRETILVIGGYGKVGLEIAALLAANGHYHLIIAGRDKIKAEKAAKNIGTNISGEKFDLDLIGESEIKILSEVQAVIVCLDQVSLEFMELCASYSLKYFDISANSDFLLRILKLKDKIENALIVTSFGLCPGLTNLLAKELIARHPEAEKIFIGVLLGLGEKHGKASVEWTVSNLAQDFLYTGKEIRPFLESHDFTFPKPFYGRKGFRFNFSDQHTLKFVYPNRYFTTHLCFDNKSIMRLLHWFKKVGATNLLKIKWIFNAVVALFDKLSFGSGSYSVVVSATKHNKEIGSLSVSGHEVAFITAKVTAVCLNHIMQNKKELSGIYDIQEILTLEEILPQLKDSFSFCNGI